MFINYFVSRPVNKIINSLNDQDVTTLGNLITEESEFGKLAKLIKTFFHQKSELLREIKQKETVQTELKNLNENLEKIVYERNLQLEELIEQSPISIAIIDESGRIEKHNRQFENLFNYLLSSSENYYDFWDKLEIKKYGIRKIFETLLSEKNYVETDTIFVNQSILSESNTQGFWLKFRFYSISNKENNVTNIINIIEDLTDIKTAQKVNERIEEQKIISNAILNTQELERKRISMELHDGINPLIISAKHQVDSFAKEKKLDEQKLTKALKILSSASYEIRNITQALHPVDLEKYGLQKSLENLCNDFSELLGFKINFTILNYEDISDTNKMINIYRIVQEAFTNILKHSKAKHVSLQMYERGNNIIIEIEDNGRGFNFESDNFAIKNELYSGIKNMHYRAKVLSGHLHIESVVNSGTVIFIQIPKT